MRLWKGIDEEHNGNFGVMTLFVESVNPDIDIIESVLNENKDIKALYFGAGETEVQQFDFLKKLGNLKEQYGVITLLEFSYEDIVTKDVRLYFDYTILRINVNKLARNEQIKVRTDNFVYIYPLTEFRVNSLITLHNGQYLEDIELYNEE